MSAGNLYSLTPRTASDPTIIARQLLESWKDPVYRAEFRRERVQSAVALQIRALREQRNEMTQAELADLMDKAQPWISQIENPEYGKWSTATFLDLAEAFDCDLEIKFRPFSRSLYELSHQDKHYFEVRSFEEELPELEQAATSGWVSSSGRWSDITRATAMLYPSQETFPEAQRYPIAVSQPVTGVRFDYQMPSGLLPLPGLVWATATATSEQTVQNDKRRRGAKGVRKRGAVAA
ncbi:MAG TPA: helix-turn-helix transcriptional regulator [Candidatus Dormibacteraeota bacterium]|jgi:transcriptional regulator with XRE-family HTH domain|nr:helix-turn-helix transcriptional regulator [Candidatus Dormibacteraeota bacterium]